MTAHKPAMSVDPFSVSLLNERVLASRKQHQEMIVPSNHCRRFSHPAILIIKKLGGSSPGVQPVGE